MNRVPHHPTFGRRLFLHGGLVLGGGLALGTALGRRVAAAASGSDEPLAGDVGPALVVVELAGGNDALNTVVPHGDAAYRALRPTLGVDEPVDLDGEIGLHPSLPTAAALWEAGELAIVEGVGWADPDLSHFASFARLWGQRPDPDGTGWLGRWIGTAGAASLVTGVSLGDAPSPALAGGPFVVAMADATGLGPDDPTLADAWAAMADGSRRGLAEVVAATTGATADASALVDDALGGLTVPPDAPVLAERLTVAARLIGAGLGVRVVHVTADGDFDTHQGQGARQPALLAELDAGLAAWVAAVEAEGIADRVVLATTSEFGRRAAENGDGTDHGTAAAQLVVGRRVVPGRHGEPPDLARLDDTANLVATTPWPDYTGALIAWLGGDPGPVLGDGARPLTLTR